MTAPVAVDYNQLNSLLWRYRPYLDRFEFLLEVQLMVTASGRQDWPHQMAELFDETARALNELDLEREVVVGARATIGELAATAPDPWGAILTEQQALLEATTSRITALRQRNTQAIEEGAAGLHQLIDGLAQLNGQAIDDSGPSYGQDGRRVQQGSASAVLFDGRA